MKRFAKIIFPVILSALLLAFATLSFAEGGSEIIYGVKFDDGTITMTYAVPDGSFGADSVLKVFNPDAKDEEAAGYEVTDYTPLTADGKSYKQFSTRPIKIQHLNKTVFASISDGNNTTGLTTYSVFDYIVEHFEGSTEDQRTLYTALLDISGAMQRQLQGTVLFSSSTFDEIGYYADAYSVLRVSTYVDGELYATNDQYFRPGESTEIIADKTVNGAVFAYFTDKDGSEVSEYGELTAESYNKYSLTLEDIGITELNQHYVTSEYTPNEFDGESLSAIGITVGEGTAKLSPKKIYFTEDKKGVASKTIVHTTAYVAYKTKGADRYLDFSKLIKAENDTVYEDESADKSGAYKAGEFIKASQYKVTDASITIPNGKTAENPASYLFETDLTTYSSSTATYTTISLLNADGTAFFNIGIKPRSTGSSFTFTVNDGETREINETSLKQNGENTLRVEYVPTAEDTASVKIYTNGILSYENAEFKTDAVAGDKDMTFSAVGIYHSDNANNVKLRLDSTTIVTIPAK